MPYLPLPVLLTAALLLAALLGGFWLSVVDQPAEFHAFVYGETQGADSVPRGEIDEGEDDE